MTEPRTNTFLKGLSVQTIVTIVMGMMEMVLFALFSRLLSKSDFGYFAAMMGVIAICQSISEAGLGASIIQKKDASERFVSTAFTLSISIGVIFSVLIFFLSTVLARLVADDYLSGPLKIMSTSFILNSLISVGFAQLYRQLKFKQVGLIRCFSYSLAGVVGIIMALKGFGLYSIVAYTLLESLFVIIILYSTCVQIPSFSFSKSDSKGIIHFGGWLTLGVILNNITRQMDKVITSKLISVEALGSYNRPAGFVSNLTSRLTGIFDNVLFPMLSDLQDQKERVIATFYKAVSLLNSISAVLSVIFFFNAELVITVFFGQKWMELVPIMRIVSISVLFNVDGQLVDCFFRSLNYVKTGFFIRLLAAVVTLASIVIGAQNGITGLAVGLVVSNIAIILIKVITLTVKVHADLRLVFVAWLKAWKPVLPLIAVGIASMFIENSIVKYISVAAFFSIIIFVEFAIWPNMVSKTYTETIYPYVLSVTGKILRKNNEKCVKESL